jgi:hypothetical protein
MKLILMFICCTLSFSAIANSGTLACTNIKPDSPLAKQIPKNFALTTPCPKTGEVGIAPEEYRFIGDATITGYVHYEDTDPYGQHARFEADEKSKSFLPFGATDFKIHSSNIFESKAVAVKAFHLPALKGKGKNCWTAPTSIRVKAIWVSDGDTDASGNYLTEFTVINVGKFVACKTGN